MTSREEKIDRLYTIFGGKSELTRSIIANVLDGENEDFDHAVDVLLNMTCDVTGRDGHHQNTGKINRIDMLWIK
jgi:hypothetical protein